MLQSLLKKLTERPFWLWMALWMGVCLFYLPAWKGGFQQDFQGLLELYYDHSFWEMINRSTAGIHSFYQLTQLQLFCLVWLFGTQPLPWFLLFSCLHALNGVLLFRFCHSLLIDFEWKHATQTAAAACLFVLFNPSMTEVVLWKACYHYLIAVQAILWTLIWTRAFLKDGRTRWLWRCLLLFVPLIFTLELWYTVPILLLLLTLGYWRAGMIPAQRCRTALLRMVLPMLGLFGCYLIAYRLVYGGWIAHGIPHHAARFNFLQIAAHAWAQEWHLLGFGRFFPHPLRQWMYEHTGSSFAGAVFLLLLCGFALWAWIRFPRWSGPARVATIMTTGACVSLAIILPYSLPDTLRVNNDRMLYYTAFFQWPLVAMGISALCSQKNKLRFVLLGLVFLTCLGCTFRLIWDWRQSTKVFWAIQKKFIWNDAPVVLILNMPSTYNGVGIILGTDSSDLPAHLHIYEHINLKGKVYDVSSYNMQQPGDGAHVIVEDSNHLHVVLNQWGSWWQQQGLGAVNRSNALFDLHFIDAGHDYRLTLKQHPKGMVILYQQGQEWRVVDMSKIGQEQW
ncbi:MAG: hypothetical protein JST27_08645 [Bacteroidetes bacterium]|nr:hypothetical protein [Bacteroidota bacterium]